MSNRYSSFPDKLDELKLLPEVEELTVENKAKIARYNELALKSSRTASEEIEFQKLIIETKSFQLNSSDWNKSNGAFMEMQRYVKEDMLGDVGRLVDSGEKNINTMVNNAQININNSVNTAKMDIDNKVETAKKDVQSKADNAESSIEATRVEATNEINTVKATTLTELIQKVADIVANGKVGIDYFKGRTVLKQNSSTVIIGVPEYNRTTDFLMVFINGLLGVEGINYTIQNDNYSIKGIGGNWEIGDEFDFVVLKKTIVLLDRYDAGLFQDGTIRKEKLTQALQDEISKSTSDVIKINKDIVTQRSEITKETDDKLLNKQGKTDNALTTTNKNIVGAINELKNGKADNLEKGKANGFATLDSKGKVEEKQLYSIGDIKLALSHLGANWLKLDGGRYSISEYPELFNLLYQINKDEFIYPKELSALGVIIESNNYPGNTGEISSVHEGNDEIVYTYDMGSNNANVINVVGYGAIENVSSTTRPSRVLYGIGKWWAIDNSERAYNLPTLRYNLTAKKSISSWTKVTLNNLGRLGSFYYLDNKIVIATESYQEGSDYKFQIITSSNGVDWNYYTFIITSYGVTSASSFVDEMKYIDNKIIIKAGKKLFYIGNDFSSINYIKGVTNAYHTDVFYGGTTDALYYVDNNIVYKSTNGLTWVDMGKLNIPNKGSYYQIIYTGRIFVSSSRGFLHFSEDGVNFNKPYMLYDNRYTWKTISSSSSFYNKETGHLFIGMELYTTSSSSDKEEGLYKIRFAPYEKFDLPIYEESTYIKAR